MSRLKKLVADAIAAEQANINAGIADAVAKSVDTKVDKAVVSKSFGAMSKDAERILDVAYLTKTMRGGALTATETSALNAKLKAVGVTTDIANLIPSGFTGTLLQDIQESLNVAKLFPMKFIKGEAQTDTIALFGIEAFITAEAATGTDSSEAYTNFLATTNKIMTIVRKSYESVDDSAIDLAAEVRAGMVRSIAEGVEQTVINGDIAVTHMDTGVAAGSPAKVSNGLRKAGLNKATVDFTGAALTEDVMLAKLEAMRLAGGKYLSREEMAKGNVVLLCDEYLYSKFKLFTSFRTLEKAGRLATLFGGSVDSVFGIPLVVSSLIPAVDATGIVSATPGNNTLSTCVMFNMEAFRMSANNNVVAENEKVITNQTYTWTSSLRYGFSGLYDSTSAAANTINASYKTAVAGINILR
jgi:HK97 family phage major capsid protein